MDPTSPDELPEVYPGLRRMVARHAAAQEVDDLTQECCVRIVEKVDRWDRARGPFAAWARRVARGALFNALRKRRTTESLVEEPVAAAPGLSAERVGWVLEQLARLPDAEREVLHLRYYEGHTVEAVGDALGISQPAASKRLAKALALLQRRARQQGFLANLLPAAWAATLASSPKMKAALLTVFALAACATGSFFLPDPDTHLVVSTSDLERTVFVDTLEAPLDPTKNSIWCASLPLAWKELQELLGGEVLLEGAPAMARRLNATPSARPDVHADSLVAGAGFVKDGIVERLQNELDEKFDRGRDPVLDQHAQAPNLSLLAYAFLYRSLRYATPFEDLADEPLTFRHREGAREHTTEVDAFGIAKLLHGGSMEHHRELRKQVLIYDYQSDADCIVRLVPEGTTDWILLVQTRPGKTLGDLWRDVRDRVRKSKPDWIEPDDSLRVPELDLHLTHRFEELIGKYLRHEGLEDQYLMDCVQDLALKFDERGVEMKSRAVLPVGALSIPAPKLLHFDEPFLLLLAKDGASRPYLALWVAHPEILIEVDTQER